MDNQESNNNIVKRLEVLSKRLGFDEKNEKTVLEISKTDDPDIKMLKLKSGSWESSEPWFAIEEDNENKVYALVSIDSFAKIVESLKNSQQESFNLKLEKTIWQNIPVDFEDAWIVAMDKIKNLAIQSRGKTAINIDLEKLVGEIRKEHPNLFINIKDLYTGQLNNN